MEKGFGNVKISTFKGVVYSSIFDRYLMKIAGGEKIGFSRQDF